MLNILPSIYTSYIIAKKMSIEIVTDSTADLPNDISKDLGIDIIPASINFGANSFLDKIDIDLNGFLKKIKEDKSLFPTTSAPSLGEYLKIYKKRLAIFFQYIWEASLVRFIIPQFKHLKNLKITK